MGSLVCLYVAAVVVAAARASLTCDVADVASPTRAHPFGVAAPATRSERSMLATAVFQNLASETVVWAPIITKTAHSSFTKVVEAVDPVCATSDKKNEVARCGRSWRCATPRRETLRTFRFDSESAPDGANVPPPGDL